MKLRISLSVIPSLNLKNQVAKTFLIIHKYFSQLRANKKEKLHLCHKKSYIDFMKLGTK